MQVSVRLPYQIFRNSYASIISVLVWYIQRHINPMLVPAKQPDDYG